MFGYAFLIAAAATVPVPAQPALTQQLEVVDRNFFNLFFEGDCDLQRFRDYLTDDVEFYHDKGGFNVRNANEFTAIFAKNCKDREDPNSWRTRRELVRSSLHVDPVPGWGAIETGEHVFYERKGKAGAEKLVGKAKFAMLWVLGKDGKWRVSRVFSFAHAPASE